MQLPNPPLLVAFAAGWSPRRRMARRTAPGRAVFYGGLIVWAVAEVASGANWVRRGMGVAGLVYVVARVVRPDSHVRRDSVSGAARPPV